MARSRKTHPRIWERTFLLNRSLYNELARQITQRLPLGSTGRVLDVGCGSQPYRSLFDGRCSRYFGCDYYVTDTDGARAAADSLPYRDDEFDTVVLLQVLEHVPRPWKVVEECARVCKPGGFLLASVPFLFPHHPSPKDYYRYTHEGLANLAEQSNLEIREITAQVRSITTLCLILTWYLGMVQDKLGKLGKWVRAAVGALAIAPVNALGLLCESLPLGSDYKKGNLGFSNYVMIAGKREVSQVSRPAEEPPAPAPLASVA